MNMTQKMVVVSSLTCEWTWDDMNRNKPSFKKFKSCYKLKCFNATLQLNQYYTVLRIEKVNCFICRQLFKLWLFKNSPANKCLQKFAIVVKQLVTVEIITSFTWSYFYNYNYDTQT